MKKILIRNAKVLWVMAACYISCHGTPPACADSQLRIEDVCRLKGQEQNTLHGYGLVVGLRGTGDSDVKPTTRALARLLQLLGANIQPGAAGLPEIKELADSQNVALVIISATVPAAGAQQGDQLDCTVSAISAKSLEGGNLILSYLRGPRADDSTVYALAQGPIDLPDRALTTTGIVRGGCKMETSIKNEFTFQDKITLVLDQDLASFSTTVDIADAINGLNQSGLSAGVNASDGFVIARAIDQLHVEVEIPPGYRTDPVKFIPLIQQLPLTNLKKPKRVVLNKREGVIIIGEDVLINPCVISHKSFSIEARPGQSSFVGLDPEFPNEPRPKLKNLVDALNALKVPNSDVIAIIHALDTNGDLYGEVIIE